LFFSFLVGEYKMTDLRIFSAGVLHETLYFSSLSKQATLANFEESYWARGEAGKHGNPVNYWAIAMQRWYELAGRDQYEYVESLATGAGASGLLNEEGYATIKKIILDDLIEKKRKGDIDIVLLNLHGAMIVDGCFDCEGDIIKAVREIVGEETTIAIIIDPHAHITDDMLAITDLLMCYREYPHTDVAEVAEQLYDLAVKARKKEIDPAMVVVDAHMITQLATQEKPMRTIVDAIKQFEGKDGIERVTIGHSFPWSDNPDIGVKPLVIYDQLTPGAKEKAEQLAEAIAMVLYEAREETKPECMALEDALDSLRKYAGKLPYVFADYADNAGGGADNCSTFIMHDLIRSNFEGSAAMSSFWDPEAVETLLTKKAGDRMRISIGGGHGEDELYNGKPLDVEVEIVGQCAENFAQDFAGGLWNTGRMAGVKITKYYGDNGEVIDFDKDLNPEAKHSALYLVVNDIRVQTFSPDCFEKVGIACADKDLLVVKSMFHYRAEFSKIAGSFCSISTPGILNPRIDLIEYENLPSEREMWPLVAKVSMMEERKRAMKDNPFYERLADSVAL
jgi:microcystin degradation protein MlrC